MNFINITRLRNRLLTEQYWKVKHLSLVLTLILFGSFQYNCQSVRLISEYDEITDAGITSLQEKVSKYFVGIERAFDNCTEENKKNCQEVEYENFKDFFDEAKVDLSMLEMRAKAFEKNYIVIQQIELLQGNINSLEKAHKIGYKSKESIMPPMESFNISFTAITKLQLALKRGEKVD